MPENDLSLIIDLARELGGYIVFLALFLRERQDHNQTREDYRNDLREVAGMRRNLDRVQQIVHNTQE
jgi:hypothetical protein